MPQSQSSARRVVCAERDRLTEEWKRAAHIYWQQLHEMTVGMGRVTKIEYDLWRDRVSEARAVTDAAERALDHHRAEHGC